MSSSVTVLLVMRVNLLVVVWPLLLLNVMRPSWVVVERYLLLVLRKGLRRLIVVGVVVRSVVLAVDVVVVVEVI